MKLCFLGKYPPIEGGVSSTNYWLARGLAQYGHEINVVTNADEIEPAYRMLIEADDLPWYEPEFPQSGGRIRVFNPEPYARRTMHHIPESNPFVTKLASLATQVVRNLECEAIFAYYLEPYAIAAALVANWTGRPLIVKHAGSDLDRLCRVPDLATAYKEVLRSSDVVVTQPTVMRRFLGMRIREEALRSDVRFAVPSVFFSPDAPPIEVDRLTIRTLCDPDSMRVIAPPQFDARFPTVGIYGKIGVAKGTYDLIACLGQLCREGLPFNFLAMIGSVQAEHLVPSLKASGLLERTYILPLLPNWKVPAFIRACTAVCFLERDFPVAIHEPIVPREVLACGTCLVISSEILAKQSNRTDLASGGCLIAVDDPKDHRELTDRLRFIVTRPGQAAEIGKRGAAIARATEDESQLIDGWEQMFFSVVRNDRRSAATRCTEEPQSATLVLLRHLAPRLRWLVERRYPALVREFLESWTKTEPVEAGLAFCAFLKRRLQTAGPQSGKEQLLDALFYQEARLRSSFDPSDGGVPAFAVVDRLGGRRVTDVAAGDLRPVRGESVRIADFAYDVTPLFAEGAALGVDPQLTLEDLRLERIHVIFARTGNLAPKEVRINENTRELLETCDGNRTAAEVVTAVCKGIGATAQRERVLDALDSLYRANIIVFGERNPGWGWTGGQRSDVAQTFG